MRRDDGFTLIEVLVTLFAGLIIFTGALAMMGIAFRSSYGVIDRTDAMQRGRLALDRVTRMLRSQVCLNATTSAVVEAGDTRMRVYVDYSDGTRTPVLHTLELDTTKHQIVDSMPGGTGVVRRVILDGAYVPPGRKFLTYWRYPAVAPAGAPREPSQRMDVVPLSAVEAAKVARIDIAVLVQPTTGTIATDRGTTLQNQVTVRRADPNQNSPDPTCA